MLCHFNGGEGGIRTHVPGYPDHLISSQRRYGHFGTSPLQVDILPVYPAFILPSSTAKTCQNVYVFRLSLFHAHHPLPVNYPCRLRPHAYWM